MTGVDPWCLSLLADQRGKRMYNYTFRAEGRMD